jgi:N4-gp56 family major capsid protein
MITKAIYPIYLALFDGAANTNVTTDAGMSPEMRVFYDKVLISNASPALVHDQFAQKRNIPQGNGNTVKFRRYSKLPKALTPLTEGVTPDGSKLSVTELSATVHQYGDYVTLSDILLLETIDNNMVEATKILGDQAGRTLDTITREVLNGGTNVQYAEGVHTSRATLVGGAATGNDYLTVRAIRMAVRTLSDVDAAKINGYYAGIIHPDCEFDLMDDPNWKYPHQYQDTANIYANEIGEIAGVRFVSSTEAKKWEKAGADNRTVYSTLILGANAYGTTEIEGGGLTHIVKQLGSSGTADPLNQRATVGWKAIKTAVRLLEENIVRIETTATVNGAAN